MKYVWCALIVLAVVVICLALGQTQIPRSVQAVIALALGMLGGHFCMVAWERKPSR